MNPVLILTHNNLELTKRCVESVRRQDISVEDAIMIIDNGSTDGTADWLDMATDLDGFTWKNNKGVSKGWNHGLHTWFAENDDANHVLVLNNDVVLPPWFYRELLEYAYPFVSGVAVDYMPTERPDYSRPIPHPDFSAFLIARECWERVGPFDENMVLYAQDCDYHVRAHRLGVPLMKANVPFYHINSQTMKNAAPDERKWIELQADADREVFRQKYGCLPGTPEYAELFK